MTMPEVPDGFERPDDWRRYAEMGSDLRELKTRKEQVAYILNRYPETRNSDKALWLKHLEVFFGIDAATQPLAVAAEGALPAQTAISRARAELQNRYCLYLPTRPEVIVQRRRNRQAYEATFVHLAATEDSEYQEFLVYSDESGKNEPYLIFAFVFFLKSSDMGTFFVKALSRRSAGHGPAHLHFKDFRRGQEAHYLDFLGLAVGLPSARCHIHVFDQQEARGPEAQVLARAYVVAAMATVTHLQSSGAIDVLVRFQMLPDRGLDQLVYRDIHNQLDAQMQSRHLRLTGIEPTSATDAPPIQVADLLASSVNRRLNVKSRGAKDALSDAILTRLGIGDPLRGGTFGNVVVTYHGDP